MTLPTMKQRGARSGPGATTSTRIGADLDALAAMGSWYVTAHTVRTTVRNGRVVAFPGSLAHAKRMGTLLTACGAWTYSWQKIYDLSFPLPHEWRYVAESCPVCLDVVLHEAGL